MPSAFPFVYVCNLLDRLDDLVYRQSIILPTFLKKKKNTVVVHWFGSHCLALDNLSREKADNVLAMLQPAESRKGYVYGFDAGSLEQVIARALNLEREHLPELQQWRKETQSSGPKGRCDLGYCVEQLMKRHQVLHTSTRFSSSTN